MRDLGSDHCIQLALIQCVSPQHPISTGNSASLNTDVSHKENAIYFAALKLETFLSITSFNLL